MNTQINALMIAGILGLSGTVTADMVWPADEDWIALKQGADYYYDAEGDQSPSAVDLIGTTDTYSAGYWALAHDGYNNGLSLEDAFMFRMRVGGESGKFVWQAHLDTDGDASNVEWIFQLVQSGSNDRVILIKTAVGGTTLSDVDTGSNIAAWTGDIATFSRWTAITNSTHHYVDFAIPWNTFTAITGVSDLHDIRALISTSTTHSGINKDAPLGNVLTEQISNVLSESIPEPAVASLLVCAGGGIIFYRRLFSGRTQTEEESTD